MQRVWKLIVVDGFRSDLSKSAIIIEERIKSIHSGNPTTREDLSLTIAQQKYRGDGPRSVRLPKISMVSLSNSLLESMC